MRTLKQVQAILISIALATSAFASQAPAGSTSATPQNQSATQSAAPSAAELQSLVAPIALYPDALLAQVLAGSTYPTQIVEAERWLQQNSGLKGEQLAAAVDKQPWDPSIKGLSQFPSVLKQMSQNLSWTSALGDAYFNDPVGVMNAVQALRKDATVAGTLKTTPEQTVTTEGQTIVIEPSQPDVVYVPSYSPAVVYGGAVAPYPDYSGWDVAAASMLSFGVGTLVGGAMGGWGWGWGHWGTNWHGGAATFNRNTFVSRSNTFANRNTRYNRGAYGNRNVGARPGNRPATLPANRYAGAANRSGARTGAQTQNFANRQRQSSAASRGFGQAGQSARGTGGNAFSGVRQGGSARFDSSRGRSSFGGGRSGGRSGGGRSRGGGGGRGGGGRGGGRGGRR